MVVLLTLSLPDLRCVLLTKVIRDGGHREVGEGRCIAARYVLQLIARRYTV